MVKILFLFLIIAINILGVEAGGVTTGYYTVGLGYTNRQGRLYAPRPNYIWRNPFEEIVRATVVSRATFYHVRDAVGSSNGNKFGHHEIQVSISSNEADIVPRFDNLSATSPFSISIEKRNDDKTLYWIIEFTSASSSWQSLVGDIVMDIPWSVEDNIYNLKYRRDQHQAPETNVNSTEHWIGGFQLLTYLNAKVSDINFEKVVFSPGAGDITKYSDIQIAGARNKNIQITVPPTIKLTSPHNDYEIPVNLVLDDGGIKGNDITVVTGADGRKNLKLEATLMPGKYADYNIYEGRYIGEAVVEFVYN